MHSAYMHLTHHWFQLVEGVLGLSLGWSWEFQAQSWRCGRPGGWHACCLKAEECKTWSQLRQWLWRGQDASQFSVSFFEGQVVQKNCTLTKTWEPIVNSGAGFVWHWPRPDSEIDLFFQLNMQLVKVNSEVASLRGSKVSFRVNRDVQVVSCSQRRARYQL